MKNPGKNKIVEMEIAKSVRLPDPVKLARFANSPDLGPRILFFSGGSALRETSKLLIQYTHNSIHIITPFDSGGSSAKIRKAFHMPAVGDIRNRLMALADQTFKGNPEIYTLFAHRLPRKEKQPLLLDELSDLASGKHSLVAEIPDPMRKIIRNYLYKFIELMPKSFDLQGASIGNLILTAGYLTSRRSLDPVIYLFSKLVEVRGIVRPTVNKNHHLVAVLKNGELVAGQHRITGKETEKIHYPIVGIYLSESESDPQPSEVYIREKMSGLISQAELICYPMGSFYSSIIANLLPRGVGTAISRVTCPKIYIPNTTPDPESMGCDLADQVEILLHHLRKDNSAEIKNKDVLNFVVVDRGYDDYPGEIDEKRINQMGVRLIDYPLVTSQSSPLVDARQLLALLLSFN
ncbi:MAG: GAK system CofD-like protein [Desulfosalsimonadaceae bacterium]